MRYVIKYFILSLIILLSFISSLAQNLTIESVNEFENPKHQDRLGDFAYADTLFVKGTYSNATATKISISLLTFKKSPWTKTDSYAFDLPAPLNGTIDTFLVVPQDYTLLIPDG
ncbi:hypothetical protein [uncultured Draconibacterium sp.]|uniref:hypothetical protein n=1 Tax=uncultured Draconibacterium sp. TaxID=1573823 RepID=UPI0025D267A8|nr:hypothetical protein [uncultured Draconibacterium sp.]